MAIYLELAGDPQIFAERSFFSPKPYTLDQKRLIAKIDSILAKYELSPLLLDDELPSPAEGVEFRCRHAFAVGKIKDSTPDNPEYDIFRTYRTPQTSGPFYHPGPDPATCKVSAICAATAATKYFLEPYTIRSKTYSDMGFPNPHNITSLALDEAYHIYGEKPPLSVIVNIGPCIPSDNDVEKLQALSRRFSWPYWLQGHNRRNTSLKGSSSTSPTSTIMIGNLKNFAESPERSETSSSSSSEAEQVELRIEGNIKQRLQTDYNDSKIFMRLAPPPARDELALNDVRVISQSSKEIEKFLGRNETKQSLRDAAERCCVSSSVS